MAFEKLTNKQIREMETWAANKRKITMNATEEKIVSKIEKLKEDNWKGYKINDGSLTAKELQEQLDWLKEKKV